MLGDGVYLPWIHNFGDDGHAGRTPNVGEHLEGRGAESLKGVWGSSRLECAAAEHDAAGVAHRLCSLAQHLRSSHRAGSRNYGNGPPSKCRNATWSRGIVTHAHNRWPGSALARRKLVRLGHRQDVLDPGHGP